MLPGHRPTVLFQASHLPLQPLHLPLRLCQCLLLLLQVRCSKGVGVLQCGVAFLCRCQLSVSSGGTALLGSQGTLGLSQLLCKCLWKVS